jgi:xylan 1,4-beta-xylosidase
MSTPFRNPILPGFHPDPSICRVGDDYYLATSTFEWFPGVALHHSRDLVNWRPVGHALTRRSQLDLRGVTDSAGLWAPSLSFAEGKFWLVVALLRTTGMGRPFKDAHVLLLTAPSIEGPWSEPVHVNSIGFDPSLFHDDDGRKWIANMQWDFRKGRHRFAGIVVQEYDAVAARLVGEATLILQKPVLTEGPNLYKHDGWYYLMLAEGGTGWNHGISAARSRKIDGPYELDPQPSVMTTRDDLSWPLQKAGHGELVQTQAGEWWLVHLASRPLAPERRCLLGRETCLQPAVWDNNGWLRLAHGGTKPLVEVERPKGLTEHRWPERAAREEFDSAKLDATWQTLRVPADESWLSLNERPGWLRLRGRESLHSLSEQSVVVKRLQTVRARAETKLEFSPVRFTQMAGLMCWYDTRTHFYLRVTHDETRGKVLGIILTDDAAYDELAASEIAIGDWPEVYLRADIDRNRLQFFASSDGKNWRAVGPVLDASKLSDDYGQYLHFTGAMVGLAAHDMNATRAIADFDYFELKPDFDA